MSGCLQEDCQNWNGHGCPCEVLDIEPECVHDWTLRPESDTSVCEICGDER